MAMFTNQMRFTGMSGLDVNGMVTQLMQAHSIRLDRMRQSREVVSWQQEAMRGVATNLRAFRDQNLSFTQNQASNIRARANFANLTTTITNRDTGNEVRGISVSTTDVNNTNVRNIEVESVAQGDLFRSAQSHNRSIRANSAFNAFGFRGEGLNINVNLNGRNVEIFASESVANGWNNSNDFLSWFNFQLHDHFGVDASGDPNVVPDTAVRTGANERQHVFATLEMGRLVINAREGNMVTISDGSGSTGTNLERFGFATNRTPEGERVGFLTNMFNPNTTSMTQFMGTTNFAFTINDTRFEFNGNRLLVGGNVVMDTVDPANLTVQHILNAVNASDAGVRMSFNSSTGRFSMESRESGAAQGRINFSGNFLNQLGFNETASRVRQASDAVVRVDGERFVRSNNSFEVDGLRITLNPDVLTFPTNEAGQPQRLNLQVGFERDNEQTMQMIRDFVDEYNQLIRSIRDLTETNRPRATGGGFFMPLTDSQRTGMSEREIELWEEQARTGILSRDNTLRRLTSDLHNAMFRDVRLSNGGTINLINIGIRTSSDLNRFGELQIDEERLYAALNERPDEVAELFTNMSDVPGSGENQDRNRRINEAGLGQRINDIIQWELSFGGGLHSRAGATTEDTYQPNSALSRRIIQEDRRIDSLIENLQRREQRYFQTFGRLEAAMIQSNSQMMFLEQLFWMG